MFDKVKIVRLDDMGREVVTFTNTEDFDGLAQAVTRDFPNSVIEIKFV